MTGTDLLTDLCYPIQASLQNPNMSFSAFKEVIEEGDTVILYIGVSQMYALEVRH